MTAKINFVVCLIGKNRVNSLNQGGVTADEYFVKTKRFIMFGEYNIYNLVVKTSLMCWENYNSNLYIAFSASFERELYFLKNLKSEITLIVIT